ncbi:hypothetical protein [Candidatus Uabimicrobium amorphum]|uniref:Uncharacterized protein n=1 Tax=Uabimicrobium amorphum TaxID=2596890 RepID=A0A5S9IMJ8_UABAM|nr:hypothetical protein [Candidatus Uabimicrobium amorphum]BBM84101.1 hypothetical protein UABAM_02457 [Candidatus Uabimicrobium amorphum]
MNSPSDSQTIQFYQILNTFLKTVGKNHSHITNLLREFKNLRIEYLETLRDNIIPELVKSSQVKENLGPQQLVTLLGGMSASFRSEQKKSYQFLENTLCEELLTKVPQQVMEQGFEEINELRSECRSLINENEEYKKKQLHLEKRVMELEQKCNDLSEQLQKSESSQQEMSGRVHELEGKEKAVQDYEDILGKIRKEIEGKSVYDLWRLKIMYNRIASLTRSNWTHPGTPKPDVFTPKSFHAKKFLDSIKPDH